MSVTLDERARAAGEAVRAATELRSATEPSMRTRAPIRVVVTAIVLVVAVSVGVFFALRAASPRKGGAASQPPSGGYQATAILTTGGSPRSEAGRREISANARLLTSGTVLRRAAGALDSSQTDLINAFRVSVDAKVGAIEITSRQSDAARAKRMVNTVGQAFVRHFEQIEKESYAARLARMMRNDTQAREQLASAKEQKKAHGGLDPRGDVLGLTNTVKQEDEIVAEVRSEGPFPAQYRLIEADGTVHLASDSSGSRRALDIGLVIAMLVLGAAAGFGLGRRRTAPRT